MLPNLLIGNEIYLKVRDLGIKGFLIYFIMGLLHTSTPMFYNHMTN